MSQSPQRERSRRLQAVTLALTGVLGVALVGLVYFVTTSLPFLAVTPGTDPVFGAANACLLEAVKERLGFAVRRDGAEVAAWSTHGVVLCRAEAKPITQLELRGITLGAYDAAGALWLSAEGALYRLSSGGLERQGTLAPIALAGTSHGVLAVDADGTLVAVAAGGTVTATRTLPIQRNVNLATNASGTLVAVWGQGRFSVVDAVTLASLPAELACPVSTVWWRPEPVLLVADCVDVSFEVNVVDGRSALLPPRQRPRGSLSGPRGVYVEACDMLPCSVEGPR